MQDTHSLIQNYAFTKVNDFTWIINDMQMSRSVIWILRVNIYFKKALIFLLLLILVIPVRACSGWENSVLYKNVQDAVEASELFQ